MSRPRIHKSTLPPYVRIRHGSYCYKDKALCRVSEGLPRMYEVLGDRLRGPIAESVPAAVSVYKREYLPTLAASNRRNAERALNKMAHEFAEFRVADVQTADIQGAIKDLYAGRLTAGRHFRAYASGFFAWAILQRMREVNPCREMRLKTGPDYISPWTDELFYAIRDKLQPMLQVYHDLSFLLYQRTTEVRLLKRSQIKNGVIHFEPTKTAKSSGASVNIPVTPDIQAVLDAAAAIGKEWGVVCTYVVHTRAGTAFANSSVYSAYRRADIALHGEAVGLNPKALRKHASQAAEALGFTVRQIQTGLAHTKMGTTEGYLRKGVTAVSEVVLTLPERPRVLDNIVDFGQKGPDSQ